MIFVYGNVQKLAGKPWVALEIRNEDTIEVAVRRICDAVPHVFDESTFQLLVPVGRRDLHVFELATGTLLYARSDDRKALLRLKQATGVVGVVTEGENSRSPVILIEDEYVQGIIALCRKEYDNRIAALRLFSFVRFLDGRVSGLCGTVIELENGRAKVQIRMRSKYLYVDTPLGNLVSLDHVGEFKRVNFYSPLVEELDHPILRYYQQEPARAKADQKNADEGPRKRHQRKNVSVLIRGMAQKGERKANKIGAEIIRLIAAGEVPRLPKNLNIIFAVIKQEIAKADPATADYREMHRKEPQFYMSFKTFIRMAGNAGITLPAYTPKDQVMHDGRSRERRWAKNPKPEKPPKPVRQNKVDWKDRDARNRYSRELRAAKRAQSKSPDF